MSEDRASFRIGQLVHHKLFDYRGVVYDVDPVFSSTDEWYEEVAKSRPPKQKPWYHILVHGSLHTTYVAERNLEEDQTGEPIEHPMTEALFADFIDGVYVPRSRNLN